MRKGIIAVLTTVALAFSANAANFSWNTAGSVSVPGVNQLGNTLTDGYAVFIWSVDGSSIFNGGAPTVANRLPLDASDRVLDATSTVAANGRMNSGTRTVTWGAEAYTIANPPPGVDVTPLFPSVGASQQLDFYVIVYNNSDMSKATHYQVLSKLNVAGPAAASSAMAVAFGTLTQAGWQPIPEPTTMALTLIGAGALALRRRFSKKS
jgi:hypothetical protein